jgi:hypothetical protein
MQVFDQNNAALAVPMSLQDLAELPISLAQANAQWAWCSRHVFTPAGLPVQFKPLADDSAMVQPVFWLRLNFAGQDFGLALPQAWAASLFLMDGWTQDGMDDASLDAWCRVRWASAFPAGLLLLQAGFSADGAGFPSLDTWPITQSWQGLHLDSQERSGHDIQLWAPVDFPLQSAAKLVGACAQTVQASPMAHVHLNLPLIAARWTADATDVIDLAVGDLLVLG